MSYFTFKNGETPLNDTNLNNMQDAIKSDLDSRVYAIKGTINIASGNKSGASSMNYPTGFNSENTVVVSYGLAVNDLGYNYYGTYTETSDYNAGNVKRRVFLKSNQIQVWAYRPDSQTGDLSINYKLVLMKVAYK